ncbi:MAG: hypothetical protein HY403_05875 [Elusimicrobia bacterium]|nr:hypothetical protein [Elusimicrobiota bacterium]
MNSNMRRASPLLLAAALCSLFPAPDARADGCSDCHKKIEFKVTNKKLFDYYENWEGSAHEIAGASCSRCHGGDPAATTKEAAHQGVFDQSNPRSATHYKKIPATCGQCHAEIQAHFIGSKHYQQLRDDGSGPNCVTCHGSMSSKKDNRPILADACSRCHNAKTGIRPEIDQKAREVIARLKKAEGYRMWTNFYFESIKQPKRAEGVNALFKEIAKDWHEFDFARLDHKSAELLDRLQVIFNQLKTERAARESRR